MKSNKIELLEEVANYYSNKLSLHGETPRGVDWNGEESQILRFSQLCKIINAAVHDGFSLTDIGCGYGALLDYLHDNYSGYSYLGVDVSEDMINAARSRYSAIHRARFIKATQPDCEVDYSIASGIFNVRLGRSDEEWYEYLQHTLDMLNSSSRMGFAFNCLTSYSDEDKKRNYLYYADPCRLFHLCKRRYSGQVALLHDYGLYEFTILVRKS